MTIKRSCPDTTDHVDHYWSDSWCKGVDGRVVITTRIQNQMSGLLEEYLNDVDDAGLQTETFMQGTAELVVDFGLWLTLRDK